MPGLVMAYPMGEAKLDPLRVDFDQRLELEFLEGEGFLYAIRLARNQVLRNSIAHLLRRPVGRPPKDVRRTYASFSTQAGTWDRPRRVVAKVEWHPGELYPRLGLDPLRGSSVTNLTRPAQRVVAFYN